MEIIYVFFISSKNSTHSMFLVLRTRFSPLRKPPGLWRSPLGYFKRQGILKFIVERIPMCFIVKLNGYCYKNYHVSFIVSI